MTHIIRDMTHIIRDMTHIIRDMTHIIRDMTHIIRDMTHIIIDMTHIMRRDLCAYVSQPLLTALPSMFGKGWEGVEYTDYAWATAAVLSRMWNMRDEEALEFLPNGEHIGTGVGR